MNTLAIRRILILSSAISAISVFAPEDAMACEYFAGTGNIECGTNTASTDTLILDGASTPVVQPGSDAITNGGAIGSSISGIFDAGRNSDDITISNFTINGNAQSVDVNAAPDGILGSLFGGNGSDDILLNNVTTTGSVVGDYGAGSNSGVDNITVNNSNIGGAIVGGGGADTIVVNGNSTISNGIGYRDLVNGIDREDGGDDIIINNGVIGINDSGTTDTSDDYSIYTGFTGDNVYLFGGTIQGDVILYSTEGAIDRLYIDPGAIGGIADNEYSTALQSNITQETTNLSISSTSFDGGDGNDEAFLYNLRMTGVTEVNPGSTTRYDVLAEDTQWTSFSFLNVNNSEIDIVDSSVNEIRLINNSALIQRDGALTITGNDGNTSASSGAIELSGTSVIDMQDGVADDYIAVGRYRADDGSVLRIDADVTQQGWAADDSDYIITPNSQFPGSIYNESTDTVAYVDVNVTGAASASGVRRIIDDTGRTDPLEDPGTGAVIDASDDYAFVVDPSTTARTFWLEEGSGGYLYLKWTTPVNAQTTGALVGGGSSSGSGGSAPAGPEQAAYGVAMAEAALAVNGNIADLARKDTLPLGIRERLNPEDPDNLDDFDETRLSGRNDKACWDNNGMQVWGDLDTRSGELGSTDYDAYTARIGAEIDLGREKLDDCGRFVAGIFGYLGNSDIDSASGSSTGMDTLGGGGYVRFGSNNGVYGTLLGHYGTGDVTSFNATLASMADYSSDIYGAAANLGRRYATDNGDIADVRGFVNWTGLEAGAFTDSMGLTVDGIDGSVLVAGFEVGLERQFDETTSGFGRIGGKLTDFEGTLESSGTAVNFGGDYVAATFEAGVQKELSEQATVSLSGFGEVADGATLYGGRVSFNVKF